LTVYTKYAIVLKRRNFPDHFLCEFYPNKKFNVKDGWVWRIDVHESFLFSKESGEAEIARRKKVGGEVCELFPVSHIKEYRERGMKLTENFGI